MLAEGFAREGVPVVLADVKGDLGGLAVPGAASPKLTERLQRLGIADLAFAGFPVVVWDVFGQDGHPLRVTISDLGPLLLARLLDLNDVQAGVLQIAFRLADDEGLLLIDLADLRAVIAHVAERAAELSATYGNVAAASVGAIQRALLTLEEQGGAAFFGEPMLDIADLMLNAPDGRGAINILAVSRLIQNSRAYSTVLLWLLAELYENLPKICDAPKPKLVVFFDESHLMFDGAPKALGEKVEQVVRLIRSKGVGLYFVTQNPMDVPDAAGGQPGNRMQHGLRALTAKEQKVVRAVAETFRAAPGADLSRTILDLGVGEGVVSFLKVSGAPGVAERVTILPPTSRIGALSADERAAVMAASPVKGVYDQTVDRESAAEILGRAKPAPSGPWRHPDGAAPRTDRNTDAAPERTRGRNSWATEGRDGGLLDDLLTGGHGRRQSVGEALAKSVVHSVGSQVGRAIVRGVLGSLLKR